MDGISGNGIHGFQDELFASTPSQVEQYNALRTITEVSWKSGQTAEVLESVESIKEAEEGARIELEQIDVVINMPQIVWPDDQMVVKDR